MSTCSHGFEINLSSISKICSGVKFVKAYGINNW